MNGRVDAAAAVAAAASAVGNEDTTPPTVAFSEPTASSTVSGITTVTVAAADAASGIASVALYVDGGLFNTDATAPYAFGWDTTALSDGLVQLTAVATDNAGNSADATVSVAVSNNIAPDTTAPDVVIDTPSGGATVSRTVQISAHATDDTAIVTMSVRVDGTHLCSSGQSTISCGWNSRKTASGSHEIQVTATDSAGNTTSVSVEVIVSGGGSSGPKGGGKGGGRKK